MGGFLSALNNIILLIYLSVFSVLNRSRGSHFYDFLSSTTESRFLATFLMAASTGILATIRQYNPIETAYIVLWVWGSLFLWCDFAWDNYWGAAIGSTFDPNKRTFPPADWIAKKIPFFKSVYSGTASSLLKRLWGLFCMSIRQSLDAICIVGLAIITHHNDAAFYALFTPLLALPYFINGYLTKSWAVEISEYEIGPGVGYLIAAVL